MRVLWAFFRRDLQVASSYRVGALLFLFGGLATLSLFYFLAKTMGEVPLLRGRHGTDYFSFALVGLAVATCLRSLQSSFATRLREAQLDGSLEALLCAPFSTLWVFCGLAIYPIASAVVRSAGLLAAGVWLFGAQLAFSPLAFGAVFLAALLAFVPLGLLAASYVLVFKRGEPFSYLLDTAAYLLAGVVFPIEVLPDSLSWASRLLPATYALEGLRASALRNAGLESVASSLIALLAFAVILWPLAALVLASARRHVERAGTLPQA